MRPTHGERSDARLDLACIGDVMMDFHFVLPLETWGDEKVHAVKSLRTVGGTAANAAAAARSLGSSVMLYATVGTDALASWVLHELQAAGLRIDNVHRKDGHTGVAFITHRGSQRSVVINAGVAASLDHLDVERAATAATTIYLTGVSATTARAVLHRAPGLTVLNCEAWQLDRELDVWMDLLPSADVMVGNSAIKAEHIERIQQHAPALTMIITTGAEGAMVYQPPHAPLRVPAPAVEVVDATGAGDCFAGTLCHYLSTGLELSAAVEHGVLAASLSTMSLGAQRAVTPNEGPDPYRSVGVG